MKALDLLSKVTFVPERNELNLKNENQNKPCTQNTTWRSSSFKIGTNVELEKRLPSFIWANFYYEPLRGTVLVAPRSLPKSAKIVKLTMGNVVMYITLALNT